MDPITLAVVTSAVTTLASEVGKGIAGEAGKSAWGKIKAWFQWSTEPAEAELSSDHSGLASHRELRGCWADSAETRPTGVF